MHFLIVLYTACKSLAKWWRLFLGTSHFDLEEVSPRLDFVGGGVFPLELKISLKNSISLNS